MSKVVIVLALITVSLTLVNTDVFAQDRAPNSSTPTQEEINKVKSVVADQQKPVEELAKSNEARMTSTEAADVRLSGQKECVFDSRRRHQKAPTRVT